MGRRRQGIVGAALVAGGALGLAATGGTVATAREGRGSHDAMHRMMDAMHGDGTSDRMHRVQGAEEMMERCGAMMEHMHDQGGSDEG